MSRKNIDRSEDFKGLNTTFRDSRLPDGFYRRAENVRSPDGRIHKRWAYAPYMDTPINDCCLSKHTSPELRKMIKVDTTSSNASKDTIDYWMTPYSYGLIREHDDFKPRTDRDWSLEFVLKSGDISDLLYEGSKRHRLWPGTAAASHYGQPIRESFGCYVYDQCVTVGQCSLVDLDASLTFSFPDAAHAYVVAAIPSMAISIWMDTSGHMILHVEWYMVGVDSGNASEYNKYLRSSTSMKFQYDLGLWIPGTTYHVALTYQESVGTTPDTMKLYVHGVDVATLTDVSKLSGSTRTRAWAGEYDVHNGYTIADAVTLQRDIVLLNEYTVRGGAASSANIREKFTTSTIYRGVTAHLPAHPDPASIDPSNKPPNYWCKSPPRGTGLAELRWWHTTRSAAEVLAWAARSLTDAEAATTAGYWRLNDGVPVLQDSGPNGREGTLHLTRAAYVKDSLFLGGYGIKFADSQGLLYQFGIGDSKGLSDLATSLRSLFGFDETYKSYVAPTLKENRNSLTIQMQIKTPYSWQKNQLKHKTDTNADNLNNNAPHPSELTDGTRDSTVIPTSETVPGFYQTCWAVEAYTSPNGSLGEFDGQAVANRVPILRGLIDEDGYFIFEYWGRDAAGTAVKIYRKKSTTPLSLDTVTTLTWQIHFNINSQKLELRLFKDNAEDGTPLPIDCYATMLHNGIYSISLGSTGLANEQFGSVVGDMRSFNLYSGHRNDPFATAQSYITMGTFRLWAGALDLQDIVKAASSFQGKTEAPISLLVNLVIDKVYGKQVLSKARYPAVFDNVYRITTGGFPSYDKNKTDVFGDLDPVRVMDCVPDTSADDCLGFSNLGPTVMKYEGLDDQIVRAKWQGLFSYVEQGQESGLLGVANNAVLYDKNYKGQFADIYIPNRGLLNEWDNTGVWRSVPVGGKLFMLSSNGEAKVFDGKNLSLAGKRDIRTNAPILAHTTGGNLPVDKWFSISIVYTDQANNLQHVTERSVVKTTSTDRTISIHPIFPSPDPRSTGMAIFMSAPYDSVDLAINAPLQRVDIDTFMPTGVMAHFTSWTTLLSTPRYAWQITDLRLIPETLFENETPVPSGSIGTIYNDRLLLAGDPLAPSRVYWSFAGQYERFDTITDFTSLEDAGGDQIVAMLTAWETVIAFKLGSIWRLVETSPNRFSVQKLTDSLGAIAPESVKLLTIPDTGQSVVFFWSKQGPYLFDGTNYKYIGRAIEQTGTGEAFDWIQKPETITVLHDPNSRELICFYQEKDQSSDRPHNAVVFNYTTGAWTTHTGVWGGPTSTVTAVVEDSSAYALAGEANLPYKPINKLVVGAPNGRVYTLDSKQLAPYVGRDFLPSTLVSGLSGTFQISTVNSVSDVTLNKELVTAIDNELDGVWVMFIKADGTDFVIVPIESNTTDSSSGSDLLRILLDTRIVASLPWSLAVGDTAHLGLAPLYLEAIWDEMDLPGVDKEIVREIWWGHGSFSYRYAVDWDSTWRAYRSVLLTNGEMHRIHTHIQGKAYKYSLYSVDTNIKLDRRMLQVSYSREGDL